MATTDVGATVRGQVLSRLEEAAWLEKAIYVVGWALLTAALAQVHFYAPWNPYVPYTGQVLGVVGAGLVLGAGMGAASMVVYLAMGALGLPVFAEEIAAAGGIETLMGATAGYLYAFPIAAAVTGRLSRTYLDRPGEERVAQLGVLALAGYVALFGFGVGLLGLTGLATDGFGQTVLASSALVCGVGGLLWRWSKQESTALLARLFVGLVGVVIVYAVGWVGLALVTDLGWGPALARGVVPFVPVDLAKVFVAAGGASLLLPPRR